MTALTVGSLFSGIGGLDLGLERAGMRVVWQSEIDPYACRVLTKHWPHVPNLGDVTRIDWSTVERPDVICGGYPCQPFSLAGARRGEDDPRHLWPHMLRALRELRPRFALLENVPGHLSLGFGRVLGDLAESGFDAEWDCIPAAAVGAPHLRDRVFVVAYPHGEGQPGLAVDAWPRPWELVPDADGARLEGLGELQPTRSHGGDVTAARREVLADTESGEGGSCGEGLRRDGVGLVARAPSGRGARGPGGGSGTPDGSDWATEPDVGRVAHGVPARVDRLRTLGNAVVPAVAEHIGRLIVRAAA